MAHDCPFQGHLPMGQSSCGNQALALVKHPQILQRMPV
jgi:hypothetical protein